MKVLNKFLKNGTGNYVEGVVNGRTGSGPVRSTSCETPHDTFKIASWNIGTMRGRSSEIVETITRQIYSTYIRTVLLYASECWAPNVNDLLKLQRNDRAMIRWTCNVRLKDHISSDSLLRKLGINNIQTLLRYNRLRWFGHVVRNDGCINSITEFEVVGQRGRGRPKKTWKDTINNDLRHWKLSRADPANRMEWRKKLRTNIGAVRPTLSGTDTLNE